MNINMKKDNPFIFQYPFITLLSFVIIAYLPVILPFFHLKNDFLTQNLPTRFFISESLYSGYFPWWNPYIHYGIPQYGDMNNGFWNPLLWIIAKLFGYSVLSLTFEEMFYVFIGGWGIFKLFKEFTSTTIPYLAALSYMCCGYILGHLQHFIWITGTAFFPFIILYFIRVNRSPSLKNYIAASIFIFLFLASTHPGLIIGGMYFFLFATIFIYAFRKSNYFKIHSKYLFKNFAIISILSILLSIVVIVSNVQVLQYITRGSAVVESELLLNPTSIQSYVSLLIPLAVYKSDFFQTDLSMRNVYVGLPLLFGLIIFFINFKRKVTFYFIAVLFFFITLSAGGIFKTFYSTFLPGIAFVRLNGEFTYFVLLLFFIAGAVGLTYYFQNPKQFRTVNNIYNLLKWVLVSGVFISCILIVMNNGSLPKYNTIFSKAFIKDLFSNANIYYLILLGSIIQLITLFFLKKYKDSQIKWFYITGMNLVINCWLILPFTGLGMLSRVEIQKKIDFAPKGIYPPPLLSINTSQQINKEDQKILWLAATYSKKIGHPFEEPYPVQLKSSALFFKDFTLKQFINKQSYVFLSSDTLIDSKTNFASNDIKILEFQPGYLKLHVNNTDYNYITFLQNNYPYWNMYLNGKIQNHFTGFKSFITSQLPKGSHEIAFHFSPQPIKTALYISVCIAFVFTIILSRKKWRNYLLFKVDNYL